MSSLSATVTGTLQLQPTPAATVDAARSGGCTYGLSLRGVNGAPVNEQSNQCVTTVSGAFVALPFPTNLRGRVLYIRMTEDSNVKIQVRLTQEITGTTVIAGFHGMMLMEFAIDDRLTLVEVDGDAKFEWAAFGDNS